MINQKRKIHKRFSSAFTLVEMLIVIVIIGILATALGFKLQSMQERSRDLKRTADLRTIGQALALYKADVSHYPIPYLVPTCAGAQYSDFSAFYLQPSLKSYLSTIPTDPSLLGVGGIQREVNPLTTCVVATDPNYLYTTVERNGDPLGGFLLVAGVENIQSANFLMNYPMAYIAQHRPERGIRGTPLVYAEEPNCAELWLTNYMDANNLGCTNPPEEVCHPLWAENIEDAVRIHCIPDEASCEALWEYDYNYAFDGGCTPTPEAVCDSLSSDPDAAARIGCSIDPCPGLWASDVRQAILQSCTNPPVEVCATQRSSDPVVAATIGCTSPPALACQYLSQQTNQMRSTMAGCPTTTTADTFLGPNQKIENITAYVCNGPTKVKYSQQQLLDRNSCTITLQNKRQIKDVLRNIARYVVVQ